MSQELKPKKRRYLKTEPILPQQPQFFPSDSSEHSPFINNCQKILIGASTHSYISHMKHTSIKLASLYLSRIINRNTSPFFSILKQPFHIL